MKKIVLAVFMAAMALSLSAQINFREGGFAEALEAAKSENKLVFMDCYTSWCGPCKLMASKEFVQEKAGEYFNPRFVSVKIDMEKGEGVGISPMPEYKNFSGALRIIFVSTTIPYASFAGTDLRRPSTRRDALALEKPSLDADVGMLINGRFRRNPQYFAPSITFPPPMPMTACVFAGMENARLVRSSNRTVSSS